MSEMQNSPIKIYNCFRVGLVLLQCLATNPKVIFAGRALRAINACSSALGVYTGALSVARSYLQLYDRLATPFLSFGVHDTGRESNEALKLLLKKVTSCEPSEIPEYVLQGQHVADESG